MTIKKDDKILELFKKTFGKKISNIVKKENKEIINEIYKPLA